MAMTKQQDENDLVSASTEATNTTEAADNNTNTNSNSNTNNSSSAAVPGDETPEYDPKRVVQIAQMEAVMNLLVHPVWIFDIKQRRMRWANKPAQEVFNAASLEDLLARDFTSMSPATEKRNEQLMHRCGLGLVTVDMWTLYPKGQPKPVRAAISGIRLLDDQPLGSSELPHICILVEAIPIEHRELDNELLRGVEMLRHLPIAVCQFDMQGNCMFQNPEACLIDDDAASSSDSVTAPDDPVTPDSDDDDNDKSLQGSTTHSTHTNINSRKRKPADSGLVSRFVDDKVGKRLLQQVQEKFRKVQATDTCVEVEAMLHTKRGNIWSAIQLRHTTDPVTGQPVLLYNAFDKSDAVRAKKERQAREQEAEFLAIMAHEIRTPLHQVTGFVDLLDQTPLDAEQKSYVGVLKSSVQGLMTVINDVLDYSKLEAGHMKLENIPYEPLSVTKGSLEAVRASCEERNLYLRLDWDTQIPFRLKNDPNRLRQILLNLLSNAIKFTKQGGITLKTMYVLGSSTSADGRQQQQHNANDTNTNHDTNNTNGKSKQQQQQQQQPQAMIKFAISDTGIGISQEQKKIIFQKYQQANHTIARNYGGTGLGLSICHSLVQKMGGSIGVDSEVGRGATFWFMLPANLPTEKDLAGEADEDEANETNSNSNASLDVNNTNNTTNTTNKEGMLAAAKSCSSIPTNSNKPETSCGLNILVAEDNKVNQKLVVKMLQRMGHTTVIAENGKEAIDMIERCGAAADRSLRNNNNNNANVGNGDHSSGNGSGGPPFDICLMDIQMPVCDGFEATKRLRSMGYVGLPILGLTASVVRSDFAELGFNDWLPKPIRMKDLKTKLHQAVQRAQANGDGQLCFGSSSCMACDGERQ